VSAPEHLGAQWKHESMPLEQFRRLHSGGEHEASVPRLRKSLVSGEAGFDQRHRDAGGASQYLDNLKNKVKSEGFPGSVLLSKRGSHFYIEDGHHRAIVAHELGIDPVPVRYQENADATLRAHKEIRRMT